MKQAKEAWSFQVISKRKITENPTICISKSSQIPIDDGEKVAVSISQTSIWLNIYQSLPEVKTTPGNRDVQ